MMKSMLANVFNAKSDRTLFFAFLFFLLPLALCSQPQHNQGKTLHVKFKAHANPHAVDGGKSARTGMLRVDRVSEKYKAKSIKRIFPDAGIFEESHQAYGLHLWYEIKFSQDTSLNNAVKDYQATDWFDHVEESIPYTFVGNESNQPKTDQAILPTNTNDPHFDKQWNFKNTGQTGGTAGADINLVKAWQKETGSPNVIVAVIDGGIDVNHPDLKSAMWINPDEIPGNNLDDDHNGYVDDIHGYGFGDGSSTLYPDYHATHVAGIIGAVTNNGIGVSGIAGGNGIDPGVRLMSCAGFGVFQIGGFEAAMVYAADNGAVISQNSWGGGSKAIEAAITYFIDRAGYDNRASYFNQNIQTGPMAGGVVIFAAGNRGTNDPYYGYPASYDKVIAVGSTDDMDVKSPFSNYGLWVDIFAPGSEIFSTTNSDYDYLSGTSMACPHVSGVAALVISNLQKRGLRPNVVWNRLRFSGRSLSETNPRLSRQLGWGRVDAAVSLLEPDLIPPGAIRDLRGDEFHSTSVLLRWTASGENDTEGQAAEYEIRYSKSPIDELNFSEAILLPDLPIPPRSGDAVTLQVNNLTPNTYYYFAIKSIDVFNNVSPLSNVLFIRTLTLPIPTLLTSQLSEQVFTGGVTNHVIAIKNSGDEDELLVRSGVPKLQSAPVIPPFGTTGRLFAINISHQEIDELDTKTGKVVHSIPMPEPSARRMEGLAFDGTHLYYGRSEKIYQLNPQTGEVIRTILLNGVGIINGLVWSGQYLYVSQYSDVQSSTYEVDIDNGKILRTLNHYSESAFLGNANTLLTILAGRLQEIDLDNGNLIREIPNVVNVESVAYSLIDSVIFVASLRENLIHAIDPTDGTLRYSFPYSATTALAGLEHAYRWIETDEKIVRIPPGQIGEVALTFRATGLPSGSWTGTVNMIPLNSFSDPLPVSLNLSVQSAADIVTVKEINFGTQYLGFPIDTVITVANLGVSELLISEIKSSHLQVKSSLSSLTLSPGKQMALHVTVTPVAPGVINEFLTFTCNDPDQPVLTVPLWTDVKVPPAMQVTPDSIKEVLTTGDSTTVLLTLKNTGGSTLNWNADLAGQVTVPSIGQRALMSHPEPDSIQQFDLGTITEKAPSPEALTCLVYDPVGELMYAKSNSGTNFYTYNPASDTWTRQGATPSNFRGQGTYLNGKLYFGGDALSIFSISSSAWSSSPFPITGSAIGVTSDDQYVYVAIDMHLYRYDPLLEKWLELAKVPGPFYMTGFGGLSYHSGVIYAHGTQGITGDGTTLFFKYYIDSNTWISSTSIPGMVSTGSAIDLSSSRYFLLGTIFFDDSAGIKMSILDIRNGTWSKQVTPFPFDYQSGLAFVNKSGASGIYFIQGGSGTKLGYYETPATPNWLTLSPAHGSLPAGESQVISVKLNAQSLFGGMYRGTVHLTSSHPQLEDFTPLELNVLGSPDISTTTTRAQAGEVVIGYQGAGSFIIKNKGTATLVVDRISISSPDFTLDKTSFSLPVGESTQLVTYFKPTFAGEQTATFTLHSNDPVKSTFQIELTGTGIYPAQLQVPTDTIRVTLMSGGMATHKFSISNVGNGKTQYLTVWGVDEWIQIDSAGGPVNIGPHQVREFEARIRATGLSQGRYYGSIWVEDYLDPSDVNYHIPVQIEVINAPDIVVSRDSLFYGDQFVEGQYDYDFQISNAGFLPLLISSIESDNQAFTISISSPLTLTPGEHARGTIRFNPTLTSTYLGTITVQSNDPDQNIIKIPLSGTGIIPPQLSMNRTELSVTAFAKESQSASIDLSNLGGSILHWKIINEFNPQPTAEGDFTSKAKPPYGVISNFTGLTQHPSSGNLYAQDLWNRTILRYTPQLNLWEVDGSIPEVSGYQNIGATILNSKMYCTYSKDASKIYIYDMILRDWTMETNPFGFATATITTDGTRLYLAGEGKFVSYHPKNKTWSELTIPNFKLEGLGGLSYLDGVIYAHAAGNKSFAKYTIATEVWENLIPLPDSAVHGSVIDPVKKRYYAYYKNFLYEYDITAGVWTVHYFSIFEVGNNGGLAYSSHYEYGGIYFMQGDTGLGFARYEPKKDLTWLRSSQVIGEIDAKSVQRIGISCNAQNLTPGTYTGKVTVTSNDPVHSTVDIPVTFLVKNPAPSIRIQPFIADTISRATKTEYTLTIENTGKETLLWNINGTLPAWLSMNKINGSVSGQSSDILVITCSPDLFNSLGIEDYHLEIYSNDPVVPKSTTRFLLTIQNHQPIVSAVIPSVTLGTDLVEISLLDHFIDPDDDPLTFSILNQPSPSISVQVINNKLRINQISHGRLTVTVRATDLYNSSTSTSFEVNSVVVTGVESTSDRKGLMANPNPFRDNITFLLEGYESGRATLMIFDQSGKEVWKSPVIDSHAQKQVEFDGHHLPAGLYLCVLSVDYRVTDSVRILKN